MVGVAQLVEHLVVAQVAVGSSPITHPIKIKSRAPWVRLFIFLYNRIRFRPNTAVKSASMAAVAFQKHLSFQPEHEIMNIQNIL